MMISVIMGTYNGAKRIACAIESIQKQTYANWELIICDDCSSDNTYELLLEYSKNDKRIKVLRNERNMRLAYTLNKCLDIAQGEFIARMDDDDYSYPERFERQVDFLNNNTEYAFVSTGMDMYDGDKVVYKSFAKEASPTEKSFLWGTPFSHAATMFRVECLRGVNGYRVAKETARCEDYDLFARMYAKGFKGYNLNECLYRCLEDKNAYKRRKYRYRIDEAIARYKIYKLLKLFPIGVLYIIKPLIAGLIPHKIMYKIHSRARNLLVIDTIKTNDGRKAMAANTSEIRTPSPALKVSQDNEVHK